VHPTLGILRTSQAVSYASAFFQSDGVPPPAPARVTQTVRWHTITERVTMKTNKKTSSDSPTNISITGNANIIGNNNSAQVINMSTDKYQIESAVTRFLEEVKLDKKLPEKDKLAVTRKAKELQSTLQSSNPDLGKIQQFKKFVQEKGGTIALAGLKLLLEPSIKTIIEAATKKILE